MNLCYCRLGNRRFVQYFDVHRDAQALDRGLLLCTDYITFVHALFKSCFQWFFGISVSKCSTNRNNAINSLCHNSFPMSFGTQVVLHPASQIQVEENTGNQIRLENEDLWDSRVSVSGLRECVVCEIRGLSP